MASNNIKYKILSLVAMAFLSVGFSYASVEDDAGYTTLDKISINTYCKIAKLPLFWFDTGKCRQAYETVILNDFKKISETNNSSDTSFHTESNIQIETPKTQTTNLSTSETKIAPTINNIYTTVYLKGEKGDRGESGTNGANGIDGISGSASSVFTGWVGGNYTVVGNTASVPTSVTVSNVTNNTLTKNTDLDMAGFNNTFSGAGNFGIGTTTPAYKLSVDGTAGISNIQFASLATNTSNFINSQSGVVIANELGILNRVSSADFISSFGIQKSMKYYTESIDAVAATTSATGAYSVAVGALSKATADHSSVFGYGNTASGTNSTAVGYSNIAREEDSYAFGLYNEASWYAIAVGAYNSALGTDSFAFGNSNNTSAINSSAFGYSNTSSGYYAMSFGYSNTTSGMYSSSFGRSNTSAGLYSNAFGLSNTASGVGSMSFGYLNTATGDSSIAFGTSNDSSGESSSAFGTNNFAWGTFSSAFGYWSSATATGSSAFGSNVNNSIANSTMIGPNNTAKLTILSSGFMGIGTTTPTNRLTIYAASAGTSGLRLERLLSTTATTTTNNKVLTVNASGDVILVEDYGSLGLPFSGLRAATTSSTIDNLNFAQVWNWSTANTQSPLIMNMNALTSGIGFSLLSTSTNLSGVLMKVENTGVNTGAGNALRVGFTTAGGANSIALNVTSAATGTSGLVMRINDDGTYADTSPFAIDLSGNVGIGTTTPAVTLQTIGDIRIGTTGTNGCLQNFAGTALTGTCSSDERLKTDITQISNTLGKISNIQAVTYKWNGAVQAVNDRKYDTTVTNRGVLAQNVELQFPELVVTDKDGYKQVDYSGLSTYTLAAVAELASSTLHAGNSGFDMKGQALTNVKSIASASGSWSIDESGRIAGREIEIRRLCLEDVCIDKNSLQNILHNLNIQAQTQSTAITPTSNTNIILENTGSTTEILTPSTTEQVI